MKKNKPKFKVDDTVSFYIKEQSNLMDKDSEQKLVTGKVYIVDENGTWMNPDTVSYDVMVQYIQGDTTNEPHCILYKHIPESWLERVRTKKQNKS